MTTEQTSTTLADRLRRAIHYSGLSYHELGRRAHVNQAQLSRFMASGRDVTLTIASRLCEVLGLELVQARPIRTEPLEEPAPTPRQRLKKGLGPGETFQRGQGRRVDLNPTAGQEGVEDEGATSPRGRKRKTAAGQGTGEKRRGCRKKGG